MPAGGMKIRHCTVHEPRFGPDEAALWRATVFRFGRYVDREERLVIDGGVAFIHPRSQQHAYKTPSDDFDAERQLIGVMALHAANDRQRPRRTFLDRQQIAQSYRCALEQRGQTTTTGAS